MVHCMKQILSNSYLSLSAGSKTEGCGIVHIFCCLPPWSCQY